MNIQCRNRATTSGSNPGGCMWRKLKNRIRQEEALPIQPGQTEAAHPGVVLAQGFTDFTDITDRLLSGLVQKIKAFFSRLSINKSSASNQTQTDQSKAEAKPVLHAAIKDIFVNPYPGYS